MCVCVGLCEGVYEKKVLFCVLHFFAAFFKNLQIFIKLLVGP